MRFFVFIIGALMYSQMYGLEVPEHYTPVRPNAIGGAYTAIANDENAVWTNPAGVSRIRKARSRKTSNLIKFPNIIGGANSTSRGFYQSLKADSVSSAETIQASSDDLDSNPFWAVGGIFPMFMFNVGRQAASVAGAYSHTTLKATADSENPTQAYTEIISDAGGVVSFAITNYSNRFSLCVDDGG